VYVDFYLNDTTEGGRVISGYTMPDPENWGIFTIHPGSQEKFEYMAYQHQQSRFFTNPAYDWNAKVVGLVGSTRDEAAAVQLRASARGEENWMFQPDYVYLLGQYLCDPGDSDEMKLAAEILKEVSESDHNPDRIDHQGSVATWVVMEQIWERSDIQLKGAVNEFIRYVGSGRGDCFVCGGDHVAYACPRWPDDPMVVEERAFLSELNLSDREVRSKIHCVWAARNYKKTVSRLAFLMQELCDATQSRYVLERENAAHKCGGILPQSCLEDDFDFAFQSWRQLPLLREHVSDSPGAELALPRIMLYLEGRVNLVDDNDAYDDMQRAYHAHLAEGTSSPWHYARDRMAAQHLLFQLEDAIRHFRLRPRFGFEVHQAIQWLENFCYFQRDHRDDYREICSWSLLGEKGWEHVVSLILEVTWQLRWYLDQGFPVGTDRGGRKRLATDWVELLAEDSVKEMMTTRPTRLPRRWTVFDPSWAHCQLALDYILRPPALDDARLYGSIEAYAHEWSLAPQHAMPAGSDLRRPIHQMFHPTLYFDYVPSSTLSAHAAEYGVHFGGGGLDGLLEDFAEEWTGLTWYDMGSEDDGAEESKAGDEVPGDPHALNPRYDFSCYPYPPVVWGTDCHASSSATTTQVDDSADAEVVPRTRDGGGWGSIPAAGLVPRSRDDGGWGVTSDTLGSGAGAGAGAHADGDFLSAITDEESEPCDVAVEDGEAEAGGVDEEDNEAGAGGEDEGDDEEDAHHVSRSSRSRDEIPPDTFPAKKPRKGLKAILCYLLFTLCWGSFLQAMLMIDVALSGRATGPWGSSPAYPFWGGRCIPISVFVVMGIRKTGNGSLILMDSGAAVSLTNDKSVFCGTLKATKEWALVANGERVRFHGVGRAFGLQRVYYMPSSVNTLLSLTDLLEENSLSTEQDDRFMVFRSKVDGSETWRFESVDRLWLQWEPDASVSSVYSTTPHAGAKAMLLHRRMGHCAWAYLRKMVATNAVDGLAGVSLADLPAHAPYCDICARGKIRRLPFMKVNPHRSTVPGAGWHVDIITVRTPALSGGRYVLLFTDDATRKWAGYLMKRKSDSVAMLQKFHAEVIRFFGKTLVFLKSDKGGEFTSHAFQRELIRLGVRQFLLTAFDPESNGAAERQGQTLFGTVRCYLIDSNMPVGFWWYACLLAIYVRNRIGRRDAAGKTLAPPLELYTGERQSIKKVRVFGAHCMYHEDTQNKLMPRGRAARFLTVATYGFLLYDPAKRTVVNRHHVDFREHGPAPIPGMIAGRGEGASLPARPPVVTHPDQDEETLVGVDEAEMDELVEHYHDPGPEEVPAHFYSGATSTRAKPDPTFIIPDDATAYHELSHADAHLQDSLDQTQFTLTEISPGFVKGNEPDVRLRGRAAKVTADGDVIDDEISGGDEEISGDDDDEEVGLNEKDDDDVRVPATNATGGSYHPTALRNLKTDLNMESLGAQTSRKGRSAAMRRGSVGQAPASTKKVQFDLEGDTVYVQAPKGMEREGMVLKGVRKKADGAAGPVVVVKRPRGRPRKHPKQPLPDPALKKRGRGRPPQIPVVAHVGVASGELEFDPDLDVPLESLMGSGLGGDDRLNDLHEMEDRSRVSTAPPSIFVGNVSNGTGDEPGLLTAPRNRREAYSRPDAQEWVGAEAKEFEGLVGKQVFTWVPIRDIPHHTKILTTRFVYDYKVNEKNEIVKYKARLVVRGFEQREGIEFSDTFSATASMASVRTVLSLAARERLHLHQFDVEQAFLTASIDDEVIYVRPPEGHTQEGKVWRLNKALYGLKQASRLFEKHFAEILVKELKLERLKTDRSIYIMRRARYGQKGYALLYVCVYVDDLIVAYSDKSILNEFKAALVDKIGIKDIGTLTYCLGMHVQQDSDFSVTISQAGFVSDLLARTGFDTGNVHSPLTPCPPNKTLNERMCPQTEEEKKEMERTPFNTYRSIVGSLMYLTGATRPDIGFAVNLLARYVSNPGKEHWDRLTYLLRYLAGCPDLGIHYYGRAFQDVILEKERKAGFYKDVNTPPQGGKLSESFKNNLISYVDSDWGADEDRRRSTTGWVNFLNGGPVSWRVRRQKVVAASSTEAELYALGDCIKQVVSLSQLLGELGFKQPARVPGTGVRTADARTKQNTGSVIFEDNSGCIAISQQHVFSQRTKHVSIQYAFILDYVEMGAVCITKIHTSLQIADVLTKASNIAIFTGMRSHLMGTWGLTQALQDGSRHSAKE
jgi:transposase InsO family protein